MEIKYTFLFLLILNLNNKYLFSSDQEQNSRSYDAKKLYAEKGSLVDLKKNRDQRKNRRTSTAQELELKLTDKKWLSNFKLRIAIDKCEINDLEDIDFNEISQKEYLEHLKNIIYKIDNFDDEEDPDKSIQTLIALKELIRAQIEG